MTTPDDSTPIWFLDVDGVINAITSRDTDRFQSGRANPDGPGAGNYQFSIRWDASIIARINELQDSGRVKVMWLTTWGSGANGQLRELIGINELEVADEPPSMRGYASYDDNEPAPGGWWKAGTVRTFVENSPANRKFIWTDDDIIHEPHAIEYIGSHNILAIAPLEYVTLVHDDIDKIELFLDGTIESRLLMHAKPS